MVASGDYVRKSKMQGTWSHGVVQKRCKGHFTALRCAVCFFREIGDNYMEMKDIHYDALKISGRTLEYQDWRCLFACFLQ